MFFLALLFLIVLAGLLHRYPHLSPHDPEAQLIGGLLGGLWLVFLLDALLRFWQRDRQRSAGKALASSLACALLPPLRMGCRSLTRLSDIWLPGLGWQCCDAHLSRRLERLFSVPMILFALMVLPLFVIELSWGEQVRAEPALALALDMASAAIWLAFSVELILMVAVTDRPVRYCLVHWIDMAIVLLPAVEVMPLFRLLRLGRVLRLEQLLRWGRLQRVQTVAVRGWRAMLLLQIVNRLMGRSLEYRLRQLKELLQAREDELDSLRQEIRDLEERIAREKLARPSAAAPGPRAEPEEVAAADGTNI
jgi:voltage-gated potassium channel